LKVAAIAITIVAAASGTSDAAPAAKGGAKQCIAAHEEALTLRANKKPHAAREKLIACARAECPGVLRKECADQLALVEKDAPTVALEARDDEGNDATQVKVTMDGASIADRLTGGAMDVEPGEHVFRFERADGKSLEQRVLVVEGEKNRKVVGDFSTLVPKKPKVDDKPPVTTNPPPKLSPLVFVFGGLALVGTGGFVYFAATGKGKENDLAKTCSPRCTDDDVKPVKRDYLIGDIALGVGIASAALAVILALPSLGAGSTSVQTATISRDPPWFPRVRVRGVAR
jgi:hypothetical protein